MYVQKVNFLCDAAGNQTTTINQRGFLAQYVTFDSAGRRTVVETPDGEKVTTMYDAGGNGKQSILIRCS